MKVKVGKAYNNGAVLNDTVIEIENGRFSGFSSDADFDLDLSAYRVFPGFIDMHTHGGYSIEAVSASFDELDTLSKYYASCGAAEFCATTVTESIDNLVKAEKRIVKRMAAGTSGAHIAGIYLEGPFLSHAFRGAHEESLLKTPTKEDIKRLIDAGEGNLRVVSIAPEIEGAEDAIKYLTENGIKVSLGHSGATEEEANRGFSAGGSIAIHTYNAMKGLNHREPGMLGASLARDDVFGEIICDFLHVAPTPIKIALRCKGKDKIVFITDSIVTAGLPDGNYMSGALPVVVKDGVARAENGALAGSSIAINRAFANVVKTIGVPVEDAMLGVTKNPAEALGLYDEIGSIEKGKRAHLTVLDDNFNVVMTIVDGRVVYKNV